MGSINNIFSSIFPNIAQVGNIQAGAASVIAGQSSDSGNTKNVHTFGEAFAISLTQEVSADGTTSDSVSFSAYSANCSGNASALSGTGKGDSAQSAFEAMLVSIEDFTHSGTDDSSNSDTTSMADTTNGLSDIFNKLVDELGNRSGTVGVAEGGLLSEAGTTPGWQDPSSDSLSQLVSSIVTSLQDALDGAFNNTNDAGIHHQTQATTDTQTQGTTAAATA